MMKHVPRLTVHLRRPNYMLTLHMHGEVSINVDVSWISKEVIFSVCQFAKVCLSETKIIYVSGGGR